MRNGCGRSTEAQASAWESGWLATATAKLARLPISESLFVVRPDRGYSGVSFGVLKKFERTGKISLESLLKLALTLGCLGDFVHIFKQAPEAPPRTLDDLLKQKK